MNILLIDYVTITGHRIFNKIHVESIARLGYNITLVGRKEALSYIDADERIRTISLPEWAYPQTDKSHSYIRLMMMQARILLWIKKILNLKEYAKIVFLSYDIRTIHFFRTRQNVYIINHSNVSGLENKTNYFLTRLLPRNYKHVALNEKMRQRLQQLLKEREVYYVPHGMVQGEPLCEKPSFINNNELFVFCPVNSNFEKGFSKKVFESDEVERVLKTNNIKLYVKSSLNITEKLGVIQTVPSQLKDAEYNYMLSKAVAVILPYGKDFKYRCSGIFFECVAYDTPVITTKIDDMLIFKGITNTFYYNNEKDLADCIIKISSMSPPVIDKSCFIPDKYWAKLL